jgi:hypothetical protein
MLKDIVAPSRNITVTEGVDLTIRGLTLTDLTTLTDNWGEEMNLLFTGGISLEQVTSKAPLFTATVIALACNEPDAVEQAASLPLGAQLLALEAVWDMTLPDQQAMGKFLARVSTGLINQKLPGRKGSEGSKSQTLPDGNATSKQ